MHDERHDEAWLRAALGSFTQDELDAIDPPARQPMKAIPVAIWTVLGVVLLVVAALIFLRVHDSDVRKTAEQTTIIQSKDDTIGVLRDANTALGKDLVATNAALATAKGTLVRVSVVPQSVKDSIAKLNATVAEYRARGDSVIPIAVAGQLDDAVKACTVQRDSIATSAATFVSDCDAARAERDSIIANDARVLRLTNDKLDAMKKLAGLSTPRFTPFVAADWSLLRQRVGVEAGARFRLFAGLSLRATAGYRDSADVRVGGEYQFHD